MKIWTPLVLCVFLSMPVFATVYYVSADIMASNKYDGLAPELEQGSLHGPFQTIQHAVNVAGIGDTIQILAGTYFEQILIKKKENLTIQPYGNGKVIISGAMRELATQNNGQWEYAGTKMSPYHETEFAIYRTAIPQRYKMAENNKESYTKYYKNHVYDSAGNAFFTYPDLVAFDDHYVSVKGGEGVCITYDSIYISLDSLANPNDTTYYISRTGSVVEINKSPQLKIDGGPNQWIEIQHGGSHSMAIRSTMTAQDTVWLENLKIFGAKSGMQPYNTGGVVIVDSVHFEFKGNPDWTWSTIKRGYGNFGADQVKSGYALERSGEKKTGNYSGYKSMESFAFQYSGEADNIIFRNNTVSGYFNGVIVLRPNAEIYNNTFYNINDDALEFEEDAANVLCYNNHVYDCFRGISMVTVPDGPIYLYENVIDMREMESTHEYYNFETETYKEWETQVFKVRSRPPSTSDNNNDHLTQDIHFYYNTFLLYNAPLEVGRNGEVEWSPVNSSFYNNIFYSEDDVISKCTGYASEGMEYDNNIFFTTKENSTKKYKGWNSFQDVSFLPSVPSNWTGNVEAEVLEIDDEFYLSIPTTTWLADHYNLKILPSTFPKAVELNNRTLPGAKEN